ncbi:MAG: flagellar hook-length control protein FliK [Deltaproteobacteria bacterium]|nr:flagellar hook-length control protein FliK [Deltaproteobacteria bacterium]
MSTLAINTTIIEYQEFVQVPSVQDMGSFDNSEFAAIMERAKELRSSELKDELQSRAERIKEDIRQRQKHEDNLQEDAETFKARRKKLSQRNMEVFQAQTLLPQNVQTQISQSLMGSGQLDKGLRGLELSGNERPTKLLKNLLENIKGEGSLWSLDRECLPALGRIMLSSGAATETVSEIMAKLSKGPLTLDRVLKAVSQVEGDLSMASLNALPGEGEAGAEDLFALMGQNLQPNSSLTVTDEGLGALGQYFLSLGLSAEAVKAVTSQFQAGESFSDQSLRNLLNNLDEPLAPCLNDGDTNSLLLALSSMGAKNENLTMFSQYLIQAPDAKLEDLLGFLAVLNQPQPQLNGSNLVQDVQSLINGSNKEAELAKTPVFNEIIMKLAALGDREISDDFRELSPALQALRGGITGLKNSDGQNFSGQNNQHNREQEKERLYMSEARTPLVSMGLEGSGFSQALASEFGGYGGRESLARQLENKLIYSARKGVHRLKMDLDPESLGRLDVELKVKNDKLTAHIRAETAEAYEALEKEISTLKASLKEAGLEMNLTLSFDGQAESERHFARSAGQTDQKSGRSWEDSELNQTVPLAALSNHSRLLDRVI